MAIIGSGPAGLTAAYFLRVLGYRVTLFEQTFLGGMLKIGIPFYRLPRRVVDKEIEEILKLGIEVELKNAWRIWKTFW